MLAHWLIICFARNPWQLAVARFLGGTIGGSSYTVISIYITEIAQDSLRSTLGMITSLALASGYLLINTLGYFLHYITVAWIMTIIPLAFLFCFSFNRESPYYLAQHSKEKAERSLRYYRGISLSGDVNDEFQQEMSRLGQSNDKKLGKSQLYLHDFTNRKARKAYLIGLGLILTNQFNGCLTMQNYMTFIFAEAGSNLPPMLSAIIVSAIILIFPQLSEALGMPVMFFIFAGLSLIFTLFIAIFVPETKGKSIQAIQDSL
ncbi:facilitated trehalose transporter Tret1-like [Drosophila sulfurigaster albostrigata]|uniref:facilitated trehalose transporter Tret1-like n=1 Tax=Drosophila sulfurigaster albostrigata TaxID=89887 RepID=UPI002D21BE92|nr:facilitated trehalose transporter Tret1-like [Drosophila sulfurigaster albostrigata]